MGLFGVVRRINLKQTAVNVILADLIDQGIVIKRTVGKSSLYELKFNAPALQTKGFEDLREAKLGDFEQMKAYMNTNACRMSFLQNYLGDTTKSICGKCDVDLEKD